MLTIADMNLPLDFSAVPRAVPFFTKVALMVRSIEFGIGAIAFCIGIGILAERQLLSVFVGPLVATQGKLISATYQRSSGRGTQTPSYTYVYEYTANDQVLRGSSFTSRTSGLTAGDPGVAPISRTPYR
jgi:hypothetical protein